MTGGNRRMLYFALLYFSSKQASTLGTSELIPAVLLSRIFFESANSRALDTSTCAPRLSYTGNKRHLGQRSATAKVRISSRALIFFLYSNRRCSMEGGGGAGDW